MDDRTQILDAMQADILGLMRAAGAARDGGKSAAWSAAVDGIRQADEHVERLRSRLLELMRTDGLTWTEIGGELGISRQSAHEWYIRRAS
jgi:hypothetical protein